MLALAAPPPADVLARLVDGAVASRLAAADGRLHAARTARPVAGEIEALREKLRVEGVTRVVLAAAGGAGVAAEALAGGEPRLVVLDTPDPTRVADALAGDLDATVLVLSVPPGADRAAADLVTEAVRHAFRADGLDPDERTVAVAAPGEPVPDRATVVAGPPGPGGPWSALSAYALVPAGLAGTDPRAVLADADAAAERLGDDSPDNPALVLGALLADAATVALAGPGPLAWVAQLLAEALPGGPLPVVVESPEAPDWAPGRASGLAIGVGAELPGAAVSTLGPPATQVLLWQHAVAVAAHLQGPRPPDDRPGGAPVPAPRSGPAFVDGVVAGYAGDWLADGVTTVARAVGALVAVGRPGTHLALHAYLDQESDASVAVLRAELARRTGLVVTFDWAPRGPRATDRAPDRASVVCQLTGEPEDDQQGLGAELRTLHHDLARADADALSRSGHRVLRLHLHDRLAGLVTVARAVQQL